MVKLITTSIIGGTEQSASHGGVYVIDVARQDVRQVMDFETTDINRKGPDWDLGLRGIAIDGETVYFAASDALLAFTPAFELIGTWRNPYLKNAGEMSIHERKLYIVSAGYDSVLVFDLDEKKFVSALHMDVDRFNYKGTIYDPTGEKGPLLLNKLRLNSVHCSDDGMYICGTKTGGMLHFNGESVYVSVTLPDETHNARPYRDGVLFNDSEAHAVRYASRSGEEDRALKIPEHRTGQGLARGLCLVNDRVVAAGSSPATVSLYDLMESKTLLSVNLSEDSRDAIHGLEVWPF